MVSIASASSRISGGPSTGSGSTARSPLEYRVALSRRRRIGRVTERARAHPTSPTTAVVRTATPARAAQKRWIRRSTLLASSVTRSAPWTTPPDATGTAT